MLHFTYNTQGLLSIYIYIDSGVIYEPENVLGISHVLEHMVFKRTRKYTNDDIVNRMTELGSVYNGITDKDHTYYFITTMNDNYKKAIDVLSEMVISPKLLQKDLDSERKVVLEELYSGMDSDAKHIWTYLSWKSILSADSLYIRKVIGSKESIMNIQKKDLDAYFAERYKNMMIFVNCDKKYEKEIRLQLMKHMNVDATISDKYRHNVECTKLYRKIDIKAIVHRCKSHQNMLYLTFPITQTDITLQNVITIEFINFILTGAGLSSLLLRELREKHNIIYSAEAVFESYKYIKLNRILLSTSHTDVNHILSLIFKILVRLQSATIKNIPFTFYKESFLKHLQMSVLSVNYASLLLSSLIFMYNFKNTTLDDIMKAVKSITKKDVTNIIKKYFTRNNCGVVWSENTNVGIDVLQKKADTIKEYMYK